MSRRSASAGMVALLVAAPLAAQAPGPAASPKPKAVRSPAPGNRAPVDFTGVWELDAKASRGVAQAMQGAVLSVRQNGNRIWIEPIDVLRPTLLAEQIVVDGRLYEKTVGRQKGTLVAAWGKDKTSLWLEAVAGAKGDAKASRQRMVWRLRDFGQTWTRQTWTIQPDGVKETFLVFRKRGATSPESENKKP